MSDTDFKTLQAQRRENILKLIAAADFVSVGQRNFCHRRLLSRRLDMVSLDDILSLARDRAIGTSFFTACLQMVAAQNTFQALRAAEKLSEITRQFRLKTRFDPTHTRPRRIRADIHA